MISDQRRCPFFFFFFMIPREVEKGLKALKNAELKWRVITPLIRRA